MIEQQRKQTGTSCSMVHMKKITKRSGQSVVFQKAKLLHSLKKASSTERYAEERSGLCELVKEITAGWQTIGQLEATTHALQRQVVEALTARGYAQTAAAYLVGRKQIVAKQQASQSVEQGVAKLTQGDQQVMHENANKDSRVFNTLRDLTAGVVGKAQGAKLLPDTVWRAHIKGDLHYHDLDYHPYTPMTNCCLIDFEEMLHQGFQIGNAQVEPPKSIQTATAQITQIIANVASSQYGGCSANRIDELLAPFAAKNYRKHQQTAAEWAIPEERREDYAVNKTKKDIYDAMQSLEYEINTLFTSNGQTPFTSLGFGLGTDWLACEIQRAILTIRIKGIGKEQRTAIFPKLIFTLKDGVNLAPTDPNYDIKQLALECATKRMYPDILNYDKIVELTGDFKVPMGCRSFLQAWQNEAGENVVNGRMNLGVVTLNLPRIALQSRQRGQELFWKLLAEQLLVVKEALAYRRTRCLEAKPEQAPILYRYGAFGTRLEGEASVAPLFARRRATLSLGYIGLYEVATAFYGPNWEQNKQAKDFTLAVLRYLHEQAESWTAEWDYQVSVYSTPSESLTDRFCQLDQEKFGSVADITAKGYYTNSFHYDVRKQPTPFEKIAFEAEYAPLTSGGFIHYCEYPVLRQNPKALEAVWDYAYTHVGYLGTNTPIDHCYACGFDGDFEPTAKGFMCPNCRNHDPATCDVVKRTCGYLGNPQARPMVQGRHKEIAARKKNWLGGERPYAES